MEHWSAVALTVALSMDGFAVGMAYGMRGITVPWRSLAVVALCTAVGCSVSMILGQAAVGAMGLRTPHLLGGLLLTALGGWQVAQAWLERHTATGQAARGLALRGQVTSGRVVGERYTSRPSLATLLCIHIRPLGLVIQVLREPGRADADRSGTIDAREAVVLGVALGLDALAAGFAAALAGFGPGLVGVVTAGIVGLTWAGLWVGRRWGAGYRGGKGSYVPGVILIMIGLWQLW